MFGIALVNLAGLPFIPAGFIAKFFLFASAFASGWWFAPILVIVALLGSVVALFYYAYTVKIMLVDAPSTEVKLLTDDSTMFDWSRATAFVSVALLVIFGVFGMVTFKFLLYPSIDLSNCVRFAFHER